MGAGQVFIIGAGPGDPDLLTLQAYKTLQQADVVLYDFLISKEILALVPETATQIYVGHQQSDSQNQAERQMQINQHLLHYVQQQKKVVRLKSGDATIFGRVFEEIRFLEQHQIQYSVLPGISAGNAAANLLQIPLTERDRSQSIVFCTGQTAKKPKTEIKNLVHLLENGGTLVLYMGFKALPKWVESFKLACTPQPLVVCAVADVSTPNQKLIVGRLSDIQAKINQQSMQSPVVFIIGQHCQPVNQ